MVKNNQLILSIFIKKKVAVRKEKGDLKKI